MLRSFASLSQVPKYWNLLDEVDKQGYLSLRASLAVSVLKCQRNQKTENFSEMLEMIHKFCVRGDNNDWKRFLACGYCSFNNKIAINNGQFKILTFKCKSSLNGLLNKIGLQSKHSRGDTMRMLNSIFPMLKGNVTEARQWTIRQYTSDNSTSSTKQSISSDSSDDISEASIGTIGNALQPAYKQESTSNTVLNTEINSTNLSLANDMDLFEEDEDIWNVDSV